MLLLLDPGLSHRELAAHVPVTGSTLSFHLGKMVESGVLEREVRGNERRYRVADELTASRALVLYRESFHDPLVDRFAETWLTMCYRPFDERRSALAADHALAQRVRSVIGPPRAAVATEVWTTEAEA